MKTFLTAAALAAPLLAAPVVATAQNAPNTGASPSAGVTGQPSRQPMGPAATLPDPFSSPVGGTVSARTPAPSASSTPSAARPATRPAPATTSAEAVAPDVARSQRTLRGFIEDVQGGRIDYTIFSDNLAQQVRSQEGAIKPLIQGFGAVKSIDFVGQENGADLFMVAFDRQVTQWIIGFDAEDQVAALLFRPAEAPQP